MRLRTSLYDLKRGILRLSVLAILVSFTLIGVGVTYVTSSMFLVDPSRQLFETMILVSYQPDNGESHLIGVVYVPPFRVQAGSIYFELYAYNKTQYLVLMNQVYTGTLSPEEAIREIKKTKITLTRGSISFTGFFDASFKVDEALPENYEIAFWYRVLTAFGIREWDSILYYSPQYTVYMGDNRSALVILSIKDPGSLRDIIHVSVSNMPIDLLRYLSPKNKTMGLVFVNDAFIVDNDLVLIGGIYAPGLGIDHFELYIRQAHSIDSNIDLDEVEKQGFIKIGTVRQGLFSVRHSLGSHNTSTQPGLELLVIARSKESSYISLVSIPGVYQMISRDVIQATILFTLQNSLGLFYFFFPIVALYLAYIYIAKPRSQGALEFILARPITRRELYVTRYIAGVLVITLSTTLFYIAMIVAVWLLFGVWLELYPGLLLYSGLLASLIAFYSLCYLVSTMTRGGLYLALSILIYLFFTIAIEIIQSLVLITMISTPSIEINPYVEYQVLRYRIRYFNPLGTWDFAIYYALKYYDYNAIITGIGSQDPLADVVLPWAVILSSLLWIIIPLILGWLIFKKANLSG